MDPVEIHLDDRRLTMADRVEAVQQGLAAFALLSAGLERYGTADGARAYAVALIAAAVLLALATLRHLLRSASGSSGTLSIIAGCALLTEWAVSLSDGGRWFRPTLVVALVALTMGIFHGPLHRRRGALRFLRMDAEGVAFRLNPFRRFRVKWAELASITAYSDCIVLQRRNGKEHRIPLTRLNNAFEVTDAVHAAAGRMGVESRDAVSPA
jgi:hypothetical protein